ncbi:lysis protein [Pseudomonas lurida]|jgi:uncharacterized iron-regulated membrane protein|uniref:lysis system i-spanin subunit Rz n=1 Tax=Pseudomonas lurida TaxID=244566 RepID=UPI00164977B9|nr:lysis system i-spanin subunit Rz [Pseudomonas lurida]MBC3240933.1 lysis protein [Pseudomonas lurida]MBC3247896.1 lysis protein [Pseudomonas lurida]
MTPLQKLAGLVVLTLVLMTGAAGLAWQVQHWPMVKKLAAQARAEQHKRLTTEQQLSRQDRQHTKELSDAQRDQARLRDQFATADVGLSVLLAEDPASSCNVTSTTGAGGVVHAALRAQIYPAYAQRIIAITDAGDQGLIALRACQAYVRAIAR